MSDQNYRAYFFNNMYLTGIHAGIQAQHCTAELFVKYDDYSDEEKRDIVSKEEARLMRRHDMAITTLYNWAEEDKTTIILNGGYSENLYQIANLFQDREHPYPWAPFEESKEALNGAITSVGIILPEKVYGATKDTYTGLWSFEGVSLTNYEPLLAECVSSYRLML